MFVLTYRSRQWDLLRATCGVVCHQDREVVAFHFRRREPYSEAAGSPRSNRRRAVVGDLEQIVILIVSG